MAVPEAQAGSPSSQPQMLVTTSPHQDQVCHCQPELGQAGAVSTGVGMECAERKVLQGGGRTLCPSAHCRIFFKFFFKFSIMSCLQTALSCGAAGRGGTGRGGCLPSRAVSLCTQGCRGISQWFINTSCALGCSVQSSVCCLGSFSLICAAAGLLCWRQAVKPSGVLGQTCWVSPWSRKLKNPQCTKIMVL